MSADGHDSRAGLATLSLFAGVVVTVHVAPGPDFGASMLWASVVKVCHGYLAYMGVNAGVVALAR